MWWCFLGKIKTTTVAAIAECQLSDVEKKSWYIIAIGVNEMSK